MYHPNTSVSNTDRKLGIDSSRKKSIDLSTNISKSTFNKHSTNQDNAQ